MKFNSSKVLALLFSILISLCPPTLSRLSVQLQGLSPIPPARPCPTHR